MGFVGRKPTNAPLTSSDLGTGIVGSTNIADGAITESKFATGVNDDEDIKWDIATLALQQATDANKSAYALPNIFVDQFEDSTGIDVQTNTVRNASEYVSAIAPSSESGGTEQSPNSLSITDYDSYGYTLGSSVPDTIQTESGYGGSYNFSGYSSQQVTGKFWFRFHIASTTGGSESSTNPNIQFGIINSSSTLNNLGQNLYANNVSDSFWFGYRGSNGGQITVYKGNTLQATITKTLGTGHSLQLVGDGTNLKLYHSSSSNTWYDNGADLIHTFTNFTDSNADKRIIMANGLDDWSANQNLATNFSWKDNITTIYGTLTVSATGNFTSVSQTAPATVSKSGIVVLYKNNAGTATLNTDLIAQVSANNGTNYSTVTLTPRGTFSSGINIATSSAVSVTSGTSCKYKISFANQSSGSKETQVYGVALQY
jgi:hypothetical protein